jgi:hypothetical protein
MLQFVITLVVTMYVAKPPPAPHAPHPAITKVCEQSPQASVSEKPPVAHPAKSGQQSVQVNETLVEPQVPAL